MKSNRPWILIRALTLLLNLIATLCFSAPAFVTNSPMLSPRTSHTATLLNDGKLLVAGGYATNALATTEIYDPATGQWSPGAKMTTNRYFHSATLLTNGRVLVIGGLGNDAPGYLSSAEVYDPIARTWMATAPMLYEHVYHTATLLPSGQVLVTGGGTTLTNAEVFDPSVGSWTAVPPMKNPRWYHTATVLNDGHVLIAGGHYNNASSAELFDPATMTWTNTSAMTTNRSQHTATLLPDGRVLAVGGLVSDVVHGGLIEIASAEVFDPVSGTWTLTTNRLAESRASHSATLLPNGNVFVAGGFQTGSGAVSAAELFDPRTGAWSILTNSLSGPRSGHTATMLPNGEVLIAGGIDGDIINTVERYALAWSGSWVYISPTTNSHAYHSAPLLPNGNVILAAIKVEIYNPQTGIWTQMNSMNTPRASGHSMTLLPNRRLLIAGGNNGSYFNSAELFDWATGTWTNTGSMTMPRWEHTATLLPNGKVLVAGGGYGGFPPTETGTAELYDPATGTWKPTAPMSYARRGHRAILLHNGRVIVIGGYHGGRVAETEIYDPATSAWSTVGPLNTARNDHTATLLPSGKVLVAGGYNSGTRLASAELFDPAAQTWNYTAPMLRPRLVHAAILVTSGKVLVTGGESTAGSGETSAEIYDPATGTWTAEASFNTGRQNHALTLLLDGRVLATGGSGQNGFIASAELWDAGLGFDAAWQPRIIDPATGLRPNGAFVFYGERLRGVSGGSSGNTQDSAANFPLFQLQHLDSGRTTFVPGASWTSNVFVSVPINGFSAGPCVARVFVNGLPSPGFFSRMETPVPTPPLLLKAGASSNGVFGFSFTNSPGALFAILTTTNVALPQTNWVVAGRAEEMLPGQFQFTNATPIATGPHFYEVRAP